MELSVLLTPNHVRYVSRNPLDNFYLIKSLAFLNIILRLLIYPLVR